MTDRVAWGATAAGRSLEGALDLVGRRLLHYRLEERLGAGGMGQVYAARDEKLGRRVAIKVLSRELAESADARRRFEREARLVAALQHPNIVVLHAVEEVAEEALCFLAMELVEGQSLDEVGQLPAAPALEIARQMAAALEAAHRQGILHRDLKPANVKLTPSGQVKILDFGLARALRPEAREVEVTGSPTQTQSLTGSRAILGTAPYMSPEQARGRGADERTDIWAFGCVVYELLAGRRAFSGETATDVLSALVRDEPDWHALPADTPAGARELLVRCLRKDPAGRPHDFAEISLTLQNLVEPPPRLALARGADHPRRPRASMRRLGVAALAVAAVIAAVFGVRFTLERSTPPTVANYRQLTFEGDALLPAISPDGKTIAYVREDISAAMPSRVMVRDVAGGQALQLFQATAIRTLLWLPDGSELLIHGTLEGVWFTKIIPRFGGSPLAVKVTSPRAFSPDGSEIAGYSYSPPGIRVTKRETGEKRTIPTGQPMTDGDPMRADWDMDWSPSGDWVVYQTYERESVSLRTQRIAGGVPSEIVKDTEYLGSPRCSARGDAVYYFRSVKGVMELWKISVSPRSGQALGAPRRLLAGLEAEGTFVLSADSRRLLYSRLRQSSELHLQRVSGTGESTAPIITPIVTGTAVNWMARVSPDGTRLAFARSLERGPSNVYVVPLTGGEPQQLTFFEADTNWPVWSPDGQEIAFASEEGGAKQVWTIPASGGAPRRFGRTQLEFLMLGWANAHRIVYPEPGAGNFRLLDPATEEETPLLLNPPARRQLFVPRPSPDGRSVAFGWFARREANQPSPGGISVASVESGAESIVFEKDADPLGWSADGREIIAVLSSLDQPPRIVAIPVEGGEPRLITTLPPEAAQVMDMTPDRTGFVYAVGKSTSDVWLVENFDPELP